MTRTATKLTPLAIALLMGGCAVGYNSTLFVTKSNIGLDAETKPPTLEMSIARREGVIAPGFEGGQTPPVMASFRTNSNPFSRFFFGVKSTFAGGEAAVNLSNVSGAPINPSDSAACLSKPPDKKKILGVDVSVPEKGAVKPFVFGTDTTFGLKVAWSGTTGEIPDTVRLGFNRKEFAWAPVFGTDMVNCKIPGTGQDGTYAVWMPPFLAVLDNDVQTGTLAQTGVKWLQYFATGKSATMLASQNEVRRVMLERMDPVTYVSGTYDDDSTVLCIDSWLNANPNRPGELQTWWSNKKLPGFAVLLVKSKEFREQRNAFIKEKTISCN
jgi:hypothetical protein